MQSNLDGSYHRVATATAVTFSSDDPTVRIYTYATQSGSTWYSLATPITTKNIATSSGRRSFKLRKDTVGSFTLTAQATGYLPASIPVTVANSPPPALPQTDPTPVPDSAPADEQTVPVTVTVTNTPADVVESVNTVTEIPTPVTEPTIQAEVTSAEAAAVEPTEVLAAQAIEPDFLDQLLAWLRLFFSGKIWP